MVQLYKGIKTKLKPTYQQKKRIEMTFKATTMAWNEAIDELQRHQAAYFLSLAQQYQRFVLPKVLHRINHPGHFDQIYDWVSYRGLYQYYYQNQFSHKPIYQYAIKPINTAIFRIDIVNTVHPHAYQKTYQFHYRVIHTNHGSYSNWHGYQINHVDPKTIQLNTYRLIPWALPRKAVNKNFEYRHSYPLTKISPAKINQLTHQYRVYMNAPYLQMLNTKQSLSLLDWIANYKVYQNRTQQFKPMTRTMSKYDIAAYLNQWRKRPDHDWMQYTDSTAIQTVGFKLAQTMEMFFKGQGGYPKYHSIYTPNQSYTCNNTVKRDRNHQIERQSLEIIDNHHIKVPKMKGKFKGVQQPSPYLKCTGFTVDINVVVKTATISRDVRNNYYISLTVEDQIQPIQKTHQNVGIDMNVENLLTDSDGQIVKTIDYNQINSHNLKMWYQKFSKQDLTARRQIIKASHQHQQAINHGGLKIQPIKYLNQYQNRKYSNGQIKRIKNHQANCRKMMLHQLSYWYVTHYDVIVLEDLQVENMSKNKHLSKQILNQAWTAFKTMLAYKCIRYDKQLVLVDPKNTTQTCANCGYLLGSDDQSHKIGLTVRKWTCPACGETHFRDQNAAKNILHRGLKQLAGK